MYSIDTTNRGDFRVYLDLYAKIDPPGYVDIRMSLYTDCLFTLLQQGRLKTFVIGVDLDKLRMLDGRQRNTKRPTKDLRSKPEKQPKGMVFVHQSCYDSHTSTP